MAKTAKIAKKTVQKVGKTATGKVIAKVVKAVKDSKVVKKIEKAVKMSVDHHIAYFEKQLDRAMKDKNQQLIDRATSMLEQLRLRVKK